tara:strand:+ start:949 stop:1119 length:171 start_codon:yes stop_codon:yes gene_type:complete
MKIYVEYQDYAFKWLRYGYFHNSISAYTVAKSQAKAKKKRVRLVDENKNLLDIIEP